VIFFAYDLIKHDCVSVNQRRITWVTKENREILRKAGFTEAEMNRLSILRRNLAEEGKYQELVDYRRLQFVRWLVNTGKLTEQVV